MEKTVSVISIINESNKMGSNCGEPSRFRSIERQWQMKRHHVFFFKQLHCGTVIGYSELHMIRIQIQVQVRICETITLKTMNTFISLFLRVASSSFPVFHHSPPFTTPRQSLAHFLSVRAFYRMIYKVSSSQQSISICLLSLSIRLLRCIRRGACSHH